MPLKLRIISSVIIGLSAVSLVGCGGADSAAPGPELVAAPAANPEPAAKPKPDMKAMFGPDYQKGDIGHSMGVVTKIDAQTGQVHIDHGTVHGTDIAAASSQFEVLDSAKNAPLSPKDNVEFLVKKGDDNVYRLLSICAMAAGEGGCL